MAETEKIQHLSPPSSPDKPSFCLRIWPPSQRTRDVIIEHLIDTFSSPSPLNHRYGTVSPDEAAANAKIIEGESFNVAAAASEENGVEDDPCHEMEILQMYSKEISKRMVETVKSNASKPQNGANSSKRNQLS